MKITKSQLKQIIKEVLNEAVVASPFHYKYEPTEAERAAQQAAIADERAEWERNMAIAMKEREKPLVGASSLGQTRIEEPDLKILMIARALEATYPDKSEDELYFLAREMLDYAKATEETLSGEGL